MDQEKIGSFITSLRKEKGLTQMDLAFELNVTNRTISNWENGKNMPDLAMFIPLCSILGITVNELISGERLPNNMENFQENVIQTMMYSKKKDKRIFWILGLFLFLISLLIGTFFFVSYSNLLKKDRDYDTFENILYYSGAEVIEMKKMIQKYLLSNKEKNVVVQMGFEKSEETATLEVSLDHFANFSILKIEEGDNQEINVYLLAMVGSYYQDDKLLANQILYDGYSQTCQFYKFVFRRIEDSDLYEIVDVITTEEKEWLYEYEEFFKENFPSDVVAFIKKYYRSHLWYDLNFEHWATVDTFYKIYE